MGGIRIGHADRAFPKRDVLSDVPIEVGFLGRPVRGSGSRINERAKVPGGAAHFIVLCKRNIASIALAGGAACG